MAELQQKRKIYHYRQSQRRTFLEALEVCFIYKFACFRGRASRSEFWWTQLVIMLLYGVVLTLFNLLYDLGLTGAAVIIFLVFYIVISIPGYALLARRLHDANCSAWWLLLRILLIFVPGSFIIFDGMVGVMEPVDNRNSYDN